MTVYCQDNTPILITSLPENLADKILLVVTKNAGKDIEDLIVQTLAGFNPGLNESDIAMSRNKNGKPFTGNVKTNFNISKSENLIVIAFTDNSEIGIDIEKISGDKIFSKLDVFFSGNEIEKIQRDKSLKTFFKLWTRKESFLKFLGTGITDTVNKISLATDRNKIETEIFSKSDEAYINSFFVSDKIYCSVCTSQNKPIYLITI